VELKSNCKEKTDKKDERYYVVMVMNNLGTWQFSIHGSTADCGSRRSVTHTNSCTVRLLPAGIVAQ